MVCQAGPSPGAMPSISSHPHYSTVSLPEAAWLSPQLCEPKSKAWSADLKGLLCGNAEEAEPSSDHEIVGYRQALRTTSQSHILSPGPPRNLWSSVPRWSFSPLDQIISPTLLTSGWTLSSPDLWPPSGTRKAGEGGDGVSTEHHLPMANGQPPTGWEGCTHQGS